MIVSILKEVIAQHYLLFIVLMVSMAMIGVLSIFWLQITRGIFIEKCHQSQDEGITENIHI